MIRLTILLCAYSRWIGGRYHVTSPEGYVKENVVNFLKVGRISHLGEKIIWKGLGQRTGGIEIISRKREGER